MLDNVLDFHILLPPFMMGFEGRSSGTSSNDRHGYYRKGGERILRTFNETPKAFTLQSMHNQLAPGRVVSCTVEGGDEIEIEF